MSWTEEDPATSLALISQARGNGRVLDVGGGSSALVDRLLERGYSVAVRSAPSPSVDADSCPSR